MLLVLSLWLCLLCNIVGNCEGVGCKVTVIEFMAVFITRSCAGMPLLWLQPYCCFVSLGTVHSVPPSSYLNQTALVLDDSRGCEANTGWV